MPKNTVYDVRMDYDSNAQPLTNYLENLSNNLKSATLKSATLCEA